MDDGEHKRNLIAGTVNKLPFAPAGQKFYTDIKLQGFGLRVGTNSKSYFVEKRVKGRRVRFTLGKHPVLTADQARSLAIVKLGELGAGIDLNAEKKAARAADRASKADREQSAQYTLQALCTAYCDWLKRQHKSSHADARNIFTNHLFDPFPQVSGMLARDVEKKHLVPVLRALTTPEDEDEDPKLATARKLRSYLRAAFTCALRADSDTTLPPSFLAYKVTANPVEAIAPIKGRTDKNPLSAADLRKYWTGLRDEPGKAGACLRLHVLTGGQRPAQLVRLTDKDVGDTLRLLDGKGKRQEPRVHLLPVTKEMQAELDALPASGFKLSTDDGKTMIHPSSLSTWASDAAERAGVEGFQLKRVRSGIETLLAEAGIPLHIRGQLQSHGLSGVQQASYDAYSYMPEKRKALSTLLELLERKPTKNVMPLRRKARA